MARVVNTMDEGRSMIGGGCANQHTRQNVLHLQRAGCKHPGPLLWSGGRSHCALHEGRVANESFSFMVVWLNSFGSHSCCDDASIVIDG